jgi:hypothetical protein
MLRKLITVIVIVALAVTGLACRKKTPAQSAPKKTEVKSQAEYDSLQKK